MLALDNSIGCIEASESDILVLYRSFNTARAAGGNSDFREAYVCAIRRAAKIYCYLALIADNGRVVVYTKPGGEPDSEEGYPETVEEALTFARSLGFSPELVNLNYSSAMREVVVRNIRILRPPASSMAPLKNAAADAPTPKGAAPSTEKVPSYQAAPAAPAASLLTKDHELTILRTSLSNVKMELSLLSAERDLLVKKSEELSQQQQAILVELAKAKDESAKAMVERDQELRRSARAASDAAALKREVAVLSRQLKEANARREESAQQASDLERDAKRLEEEAASLARERDDLLASVERLAAENQEASREIAGVRKQLEQEREGRDAAERAAAAGTVDAASRMAAQEESARKEISRVEKQRDEALDSMNTLSAERSGLYRENEALRGELTLVLAQLEEARLEAAKLKEQNQALALPQQDVAQPSPAQKTAVPSAPDEPLLPPAPEEAALQSGPEKAALPPAPEEAALTAAPQEAVLPPATDEQLLPPPPEEEALQSVPEKAALPPAPEEWMAPSVEAVVTKAPEPQQESKAKGKKRAEAAPEPPKPPAQPVAEGGDAATGPVIAEPSAPDGALAPVLAEQNEPEKLPELPQREESATKTAPPQEPAPAPSPKAQEPAAAAPGAKPQLFEFPPFSGFTDFFSASAEEPEFFFLLQPGVIGIEYSKPEDVVQLYSSINVAYVSPEGKGQETCQAYVCCIRKEGGTEIYAALFGMQSGKTRVYAPDRQPADEAEVAAAIRGAIAFGEQVGLMIEPEKPEMSAQKRREYVESCPVLKLVEQG